MSDEEKQETTTYAASASGAEPEEAPPPGPAQSADVGQALEEFLRLAEELQERMDPSGSVHLDYSPPAAPIPCNQEQHAEGLLARLFGWQQHRRAAQGAQQSSGSARARPLPWQDWPGYGKCEEI